MDARAEQRLVGVDVSHARDALLGEQKGLDGLAPVAGERAKRIRGEVGSERLDAEPAREVLLERVGAQEHDAGTEAARVGEEHFVAGVEREAHARMRARVAVAREEQVAGHAEVHGEKHLVLELPHEVLATAAESLDPPPVHRVLDLGGGRRLTPARVEDLHAGERAALHGGRQVTADRLDFRKLGHLHPRIGPRSIRSRGGAP